MVRSWKTGGAVFLSVFLLAACSDSIGDRYVGFAQCLTDKGVKLYGAYWCPHCADQKKLFGKKGFEKIAYIECDPRAKDANPELCKQKKIKGYPTWELPDGTLIPGLTQLSELAEKTQCALPADSS